MFTEAVRLFIPARFNVAAALLDRRLSAGDGPRPAIHVGDRTWTYAEVAAVVARFSNGLRALRVQREQRVLIALPDSVEFVSAFLGTVAMGAVAVPCNTFLRSAEYEYFLLESGASVLVTSGDLMPAFAPAVAAATRLEQVIVTNAAENGGRARSWREVVDCASDRFAPADTHKDEPAFWLWTSGSTGDPRAAVHFHQDAPWCCESMGEKVLAIGRDDRLFSAAKLFHAYGLGNGLLFPFWSGATTILLPQRASAAAAYDTIDATRPTIFFGVPTLYASMLRGAPAAADLSCLRLCVSAGEPLPAELYQEWHARYGVEILDGIGSTEMLQTYISSRPHAVVPGSSGVPVPGYDVKLVDEEGRTVGPNQVGDLLVRGPSAAIMYWNRRDDTLRRMAGEWFASGDKYLVDDDGYYWYVGRADDMFKVAGEWVAPIEVERALAAHPAVLECAVVPSREGTALPTPKAYVALKKADAGSQALAAELQEFVRSRVSHYKCPRVIEFVAELPKTATGKLLRSRLRQGWSAKKLER